MPRIEGGGDFFGGYFAIPFQARTYIASNGAIIDE
jgi:hypothetical protein